MKLALASAAVVVVAASPVRADPVSPTIEVGASLPLLGNIGSVSVADHGYFAGGITGYAMARIDRFAFRIEGEIDELVADRAEGTFARAGVAARVQLARYTTRWNRKPLDERFAMDLFVEGGVGKQWIVAPGGASLERRDVELGIGFDPAVWVRRFGGRATYIGTFYRLRAMFADAPGIGGTDVAVMFDMGFSFGR